MAIYDINGNVSGAYDINGNEISGGGSVAPTDNDCGWVTDPQYIEVNGDSYRLVWHDEFSGSDLDKSYWNDVHFISRVTNRFQAWTDYYLASDRLHLRIKSDAPNRYLSDDPGTDMAVSAVQTGQVNQLHIISPFHHDINPFWGLLTQEGYYECKFRVPAGSGTHTAWWCVGIQDGENATSPRAEIDITEIKGNSTSQLPHGQHKQQDSSCTEFYAYTSVDVDFSDDYHTVGFLWENGTMIWYVDGTQIDSRTVTTPQYPMMHFLSIYRRLSGTGWSGDADTTLGDIEFIVEYLRIYKKATSEASEVVTISGYDAIAIDATTDDMTLDDERGCPVCFPSYVYVNWSDGTRTEHWVKWQATQETYAAYMTNHTSFNWTGYVYGIGISVVANVSY